MKNERLFPIPVHRAGFLLLATVFFSAFMPRPSSFAQGSLTPPFGSPTPSMKTLLQIEPRTDLQATPAPAGVDTTNPAYDFIINQPGSYYLSANILVSKANGIKINVEGVTLDLNGYHIFRAGGLTGGNGIELAANADRATVRNGGIKEFARGVESIHASGFALGCLFERLTVSNCTAVGISAGDGAVLESCRAHENSGPPGSAGIQAGFGATLRNCTATENSAGGIAVQGGSTLENCTADGNGAAGISAAAGSTLIGCTAAFNKQSAGITTSNGCSVIHCAAFSNTSSSGESAGIRVGEGCTVVDSTSHNNISSAPSTSSTGMGFDLGPGSTIRGCTASMNEGNGIRLSSDCIAVQNLCDSNGNNGDGAGIHASSSDARIEGNNVTDNDRGIHASVAGNLIIKNSAAGNTTNYELVSNNFYGTIINTVVPAGSPTPPAVGGSSAASSINTTDPWANISF
jgi:parallel beta-helix repeat protein